VGQVQSLFKALDVAIEIIGTDTSSEESIMMTVECL